MNSLREAMACGGQSGNGRAGRVGGEVERSSEEAGAKPVKLGAADLELEGGISDVDSPVETAEDAGEKGW